MHCTWIAFVFNVLVAHSFIIIIDADRMRDTCKCIGGGMHDIVVSMSLDNGMYLDFRFTNARIAIHWKWRVTVVRVYISKMWVHEHWTLNIELTVSAVCLRLHPRRVIYFLMNRLFRFARLMALADYHRQQPPASSCQQPFDAVQHQTKMAQYSLSRAHMQMQMDCDVVHSTDWVLRSYFIFCIYAHDDDESRTSYACILTRAASPSHIACDGSF